MPAYGLRGRAGTTAVRSSHEHGKRLVGSGEGQAVVVAVQERMLDSLPPTDLEAAVVAMLLDGEGPTLEQLRRQWAAATIAKREIVENGVCTHYTVPAELRLSFKQLQLEGVRADIAGLAKGAGFVLFIDDGVIDVLEAYTYDEPWPSDVGRFTLAHTDAVRGGVRR